MTVPLPAPPSVWPEAECWQGQAMDAGEALTWAIHAAVARWCNILEVCALLQTVADVLKHTDNTTPQHAHIQCLRHRSRFAVSHPWLW